MIVTIALALTGSFIVHIIMRKMQAKEEHYTTEVEVPESRLLLMEVDPKPIKTHVKDKHELRRVFQEHEMKELQIILECGCTKTYTLDKLPEFMEHCIHSKPFIVYADQR